MGEAKTDGLKVIAAQYIKEHAEDFEFSNIYEDDEHGLTQEEMRKVYDLVRSAKLIIHWEN